MRCMAVVGMVMVICLVFVGAGCASATTGNQMLTPDNVSKIHKGVTTRDQVVAIVGEPDNVSPMADGRQTMFYHGTQMTTDFWQSMIKGIPIIGVFIPTTNTENVHREVLQIYLTTDDVVEDYQFSDNTSETTSTESIFGSHGEEKTMSNIPTTQGSSN